jgi:hypothetical protein
MATCEYCGTEYEYLGTEQHPAVACRDALRAQLATTRAELDAALHWEDVDDEWSEQIRAAHPMHSGAHEQYGIAMEMVGHRHSKGRLVELVNWLLVTAKRAAQVCDEMATAVSSGGSPSHKDSAAHLRRAAMSIRTLAPAVKR